MSLVRAVGARPFYHHSLPEETHAWANICVKSVREDKSTEDVSGDHSQSESVTFIYMSYKASFLFIVSKPFTNSTYHRSCLHSDFLSADL